MPCSAHSAMGGSAGHGLVSGWRVGFGECVREREDAALVKEIVDSVLRLDFLGSTGGEGLEERGRDLMKQRGRRLKRSAASPTCRSVSRVFVKAVRSRWMDFFLTSGRLEYCCQASPKVIGAVWMTYSLSMPRATRRSLSSSFWLHSSASSGTLVSMEKGTERFPEGGGRQSAQTCQRFPKRVFSGLLAEGCC